MRTPAKTKDFNAEEVNQEIKRRIKEEHWNPPLNHSCKICRFRPTTVHEGINHIMIEHPKEWREQHKRDKII
ncbi:MAG: hypothetical protein A3E91_00405 [Candidatus Moranbacteria bacterium RIFCSPHIGHO2_12_FULL_40_10]|nr:MAG: hypothetical protein A3E91_00405 [Candidatus Moranbacteria bacterium RIFCSPHIGHO2_12_FULL_40_10]